jgi:hypothetical protein
VGISISKEKTVYHTAKGWFPRIYLHGNTFDELLLGNRWLVD